MLEGDTHPSTLLSNVFKVVCSSNRSQVQEDWVANTAESSNQTRLFVRRLIGDRDYKGGC